MPSKYVQTIVSIIFKKNFFRNLSFCLCKVPSGIACNIPYTKKHPFGRDAAINFFYKINTGL